MKISINEFLKQNISLLRSDIILKLASDFTSHDFMKEFAKRFENDYKDFLNDYKENQHRVVHNQIARFISTNEIELKISKTPRVMSVNVYGRKNKIQGWKKD